jgi:hypothetical protein
LSWGQPVAPWPQRKTHGADFAVQDALLLNNFAGLEESGGTSGWTRVSHDPSSLDCHRRRLFVPVAARAELVQLPLLGAATSHRLNF